MKLENQVVSLELAKKLKELGVKQESLFYWNIWHGQMDDFLWQIHYGQPIKRGDGVLSEDTCPAYTVAELGEMLKGTVTEYSDDERGFWSQCHSVGRTSFNSETEADARAKMLIYLLENGLLNLE